jgi:hypothetical protein
MIRENQELPSGAGSQPSAYSPCGIRVFLRASQPVERVKTALRAL